MLVHGIAVLCLAYAYGILHFGSKKNQATNHMRTIDFKIQDEIEKKATTTKQKKGTNNTEIKPINLNFSDVCNVGSFEPMPRFSFICFRIFPHRCNACIYFYACGRMGIFKIHSHS